MSKRDDRIAVTFKDEAGCLWFGVGTIERWIPHDYTNKEPPSAPKEFVRFELAVDVPRQMSLIWDNK